MGLVQDMSSGIDACPSNEGVQFHAKLRGCLPDSVQFFVRVTDSSLLGIFPHLPYAIRCGIEVPSLLTTPLGRKSA
jgi:hypothetical protein